MIVIDCRVAFTTENSIGRDIVPTRGEGVKNYFNMSLLIITFYKGTFFRGGGGKGV